MLDHEREREIFLENVQKIVKDVDSLSDSSNCQWHGESMMCPPLTPMYARRCFGNNNTQGSVVIVVATFKVVNAKIEESDARTIIMAITF